MVEAIALSLQAPIRELKTEDVRLLISQDVALEYAVPVALQLLASRPMADGGDYIGDLPSTCLRIAPSFWENNQSLFQQFRTQLSTLRTMDKQINAQIEQFLHLEIEPAARGGRKRKKAKGTRK
jgi:hypothetical protein